MTTLSQTYWKSWVEMSEAGIVNATGSKHNVGPPYVNIMTTMMVGTVVAVDSGFIRVRSTSDIKLPIMSAIPGMTPSTCACARAKMTSRIYQRGLDLAKHGKRTSSIMAAESVIPLSSP